MTKYFGMNGNLYDFKENVIITLPDYDCIDERHSKFSDFLDYYIFVPHLLCEIGLCTLLFYFYLSNQLSLQLHAIILGIIVGISINRCIQSIQYIRHERKIQDILLRINKPIQIIGGKITYQGISIDIQYFGEGTIYSDYTIEKPTIFILSGQTNVLVFPEDHDIEQYVVRKRESV